MCRYEYQRMREYDKVTDQTGDKGLYIYTLYPPATAPYVTLRLCLVFCLLSIRDQGVRAGKQCPRNVGIAGLVWFGLGFRGFLVLRVRSAMMACDVIAECLAPRPGEIWWA